MNVIWIVLFVASVVSLIGVRFLPRKGRSRHFWLVCCLINIAITVYFGIQSQRKSEASQTQISRIADDVEQLKPKLRLAAKFAAKSKDGLFYTGFFYSAPHSSLRTTAQVRLEFDGPYSYVANSRLKGIHKSPSEILRLEKDRQPEVDGGATKSHVYETVWDAEPDQYLMLRFWSDRPLRLIRHELKP